GGFTTYLDRSWDVTLRDSALLRGTLERYTDEITSDGSIGDLRLAAASRLSRRIAVGAGVHLLAGSTRETAERRFADTTFHGVQQLAQVQYSGVGVAGSVLLGVAPGLSVIGWARADNRLRASVADTVSAETDLPRMGGGGGGFSTGPAAHGGRRDAVLAEPERTIRRVGRVARVGPHRCRRIRHLELVGGRGDRRGPYAAPVRGTGRPDAVRAGSDRADRIRRRGRDRAGVRTGARPARRGSGAARAPRRRAHRAGVDGTHRHHRAPVNVYFHTFGCKANQYDTALVQQAFSDQGATVVADPATADLAVVNSCTVTHESEAKLRRLVRRLGREHPAARTVVMGCAAARDDGAIAALPGVRAVVGGADPIRVLAAAGLKTARVDPVLR